jgi:hypothetical protein
MRPRKSRQWLGRRFTCFLVLLAMLFSMAGGALNPAPAYAAGGTESDPASHAVTVDSAITGGSTGAHSITKEPVPDGIWTVTLDKTEASAGETVTVTVSDTAFTSWATGLIVTGDSGATYEFTTITEATGNANNVNGPGVYSFVMPDEPVTVDFTADYTRLDVYIQYGVSGEEIPVHSYTRAEIKVVFGVLTAVFKGIDKPRYKNRYLTHRQPPFFQRCRAASKTFSRTRAPAGRSVFNPFLGGNTLCKGVFHFTHFRNQVGPFNNLGRGIAAGQDQVKLFRFLTKEFQNIIQFNQTIVNRIENLIQDNQIIPVRSNFFSGGFQGLTGGMAVLAQGTVVLSLDETLAHLPYLEVRGQFPGCFQLTVLPPALDELKNQHLHPLSPGSQGHAQGSCGLALTVPCIDQNQTFSFCGTHSTTLPLLKITSNHSTFLLHSNKGFKGLFLFTSTLFYTIQAIRNNFLPFSVHAFAKSSVFKPRKRAISSAVQAT